MDRARARLYSEVIDAWRSSCPRLTIREDAVDRGYVARQAVTGSATIVTVTEHGRKLLRVHGRVGRSRRASRQLFLLGLHFRLLGLQSFE
jgi:hypothetical protein